MSDILLAISFFTDFCIDKDQIYVTIISVPRVGIAWEQLELLGSERIYPKLVEEKYEIYCCLKSFWPCLLSLRSVLDGGLSGWLFE